MNQFAKIRRTKDRGNGCQFMCAFALFDNGTKHEIGIYSNSITGVQIASARPNRRETAISIASVDNAPTNCTKKACARHLARAHSCATIGFEGPIRTNLISNTCNTPAGRDRVADEIISLDGIV